MGFLRTRPADGLRARLRTVLTEGQQQVDQVEHVDDAVAVDVGRVAGRIRRQPEAEQQVDRARARRRAKSQREGGGKHTRGPGSEDTQHIPRKDESEILDAVLAERP